MNSDLLNLVANTIAKAGGCRQTLVPQRKRGVIVYVHIREAQYGVQLNDTAADKLVTYLIQRFGRGRRSKSCLPALLFPKQNRPGSNPTSMLSISHNPYS